MSGLWRLFCELMERLYTQKEFKEKQNHEIVMGSSVLSLDDVECYFIYDGVNPSLIWSPCKAQAVS